MTRKKKRHERIVNNPAGNHFEDVVEWVKDWGFELDRTAGSHRLFRHGKTKAKLNLQPDKSGMAKTYQVRQAIKAINELRNNDEI